MLRRNLPQQVIRFAGFWAASRGEALITTTLAAYRFVSWLLPATFYLAFAPLPGRWFQFGVVFSLLCAAVVSQYTYAVYWTRPNRVAQIVLLETVALLALLWPTGGIDSVFIWYAINPILVAASMLPVWWPPMLLVGFLGVSGLMTGPSFGYGAVSVNRLHTVLIFLLVTGAAQALAVLVRQTQTSNEALRQKTDRLKRALELQGALYGLIRHLAVARRPADVGWIAATGGQALVGVATLAVCLRGEETAVAGEPLTESHQQWLSSYESTITESPPEIGLYPIGEADQIWGHVMTFSDPSAAPVDQEAVQGLVDLIAGTMQRVELDELRERLAVADEQQRIAGELHDSVAQQLFNVSTAAFALQKNSAHMPPASVSRQAEMIVEVAQQAAKDVRRSILGLSTPWRDRSLAETVRQYVGKLRALHRIETVFITEGDDAKLAPALQTALFRIVQEACGNALSHGRCTELVITLRIDTDSCVLRIEDDGCGMKPVLVASNGQPTSDGRGHGLANMQWLARSFGGDLDVKTAWGVGTAISVRVPLKAIPNPNHGYWEAVTP